MPRINPDKPPAWWVPNRDLSPEGKQFSATHPALRLHVWCNFSGVNVVANVDYLDTKGKLIQTQVARATWKPPEVTERLIVEWGARALRSWLEGQDEK